MSQHDMVLDNQSGASFRADANNALQAIASNQSGSVEPTTSYPYQFWADTGSGVMKMRNAGNTAWIKIGLLGVTNFGLILPGAVIWHAKSTAPAGFLKANGAAVSRTTYADLFTEIGTSFGAGDGSTTFNLPDLRGEFLRGWDDSRGVDAGRGFGSSQAQSTQTHKHKTPIGFDNGQFYGWMNGSNQPLYGSDFSAGASRIVTNSGTTTAAGGQPVLVLRTDDVLQDVSGNTYPRNIALLAVIKY